MLTQEDIDAINAEAKRYEAPRAVAVDAMKIVQNRQRWIDDDTLIELGELLGVSRADMEGLATNYNLIYRHPVGRHVIHVCDSVSCWVCDYEVLRDGLRRRLGIEYGQTTEDQRFTLLPIVCLGACDRAPTMIIDGELHGNVSDDRIDDILARYE